MHRCVRGHVCYRDGQRVGLRIVARLFQQRPFFTTGTVGMEGVLRIGLAKDGGLF